ncbi:helix-turn-helix domain-containing protein [Streptomyces fulvoviolaceus]|uniref:helix-turn-helix domain-containing protein n=1 Tax=Streptomyces fulvoviolaceus TaxID=285535 RepID=UPI0004C4A261|nr:helix-turn-helix transcriptional regulator [Streptomyces fulvoviolaceus]MCT9078138.1 helix-turn-helix domain-containing protein [Streptomyces fulvoviolaceus]
MHGSERGSGNLKMFGSLLRFFRERAGMTQEGLGGYVKYSKSQVAMVERGERPPKGSFVEIADEVLSAQGALLSAAKELKLSRFPSWFENYAALEAEAVAIYMYANHVIPGLLQTEAYGRATFDVHCPPLEDEEIEARLAARLDRQQVLNRKPAPIVGFVLEEHVLKRPLGGNQALKEQLRHILDIGTRRNVEIQVMPTDQEVHAGLDGPMILLETSEHQQIAYVEGPSNGYFISEQPDLGNMFARYGILRAQALTPAESAKLIDEVAGGL